MKAVRTYGRMSAALKQGLEEGAQRLSLQKNDVIRAAGSSGDHFYFIEKGLVRAFYYEKRKQDTLWLKKENEFVVQLQRLFDNPNTSVIIEALKYSLLWAFSPELVRSLSEKFIEFNRHLTARVVQDWVSTEQRNKLEQLSSLASDKFDWVRQHFPDLMDRVPPEHLANFISITEKEFRHLQGSKIRLHLPLKRRKKL